MADIFEFADIPLAAQVACVEREISLREYVYARRVADRNMSQKKADEELAAMRAVLATLQRMAGYRANNPIGGPARMFETIAERIRAGEPMADVLADYGLVFQRTEA